ncbi:hypothetical protein L6475_13110 [Prevotella sp. E9-3]|uniref:hypothetical protein n=1 Tax=Prevotella sp. E9-3 TaxID=2913621 RepID=UPI001EDC3D28|nr:hypothetical protein [Prevotella sp. E9-3]UKK48127.1 hypothetical protein L6475_13110 [Prevotella sp. E9-3]
MKKTLLGFVVAIVAMGVSSCASYSTTAPLQGISENAISTYAEADIDYASAKRVTATIETGSVFGIPTISNGNKQLRSSNHYGRLTKRQAQALYKAKKESGMDIILDPEFESEKHSYFFGAIKNGKTTVSGWGVKVKGIKDSRH